MFTGKNILTSYIDCLIASEKCIPEIKDKSDNWFLFICDDGVDMADYTYLMSMYFSDGDKFGVDISIYFNKICSCALYDALFFLLDDIYEIEFIVNKYNNYDADDVDLFKGVFSYINNLMELPDTYVFESAYLEKIG